MPFPVAVLYCLGQTWPPKAYGTWKKPDGNRIKAGPGRQKPAGPREKQGGNSVVTSLSRRKSAETGKKRT